jgi:hypothetical protein
MKAFLIAAGVFLLGYFLPLGNALGVALFIASYVATGACYARTQLVRLHDEDTDDFDLPLKLAWRGLFWPYALLWDLARNWLHDWFHGPLIERQEYADQLRKDADNWAKVVATTDSDSERKMAHELMRICVERANEVRP